MRYYDLDDGSVPELGGSRPDRLFAVSGPQERVQRHIVEQMADCAPVVPMLDAPVPLVVEKPVKILDNSLPDVEQVIEVPKIILHQVPQRAVLREPQLAEQLVDVPVPSFHQCTRMADFRDGGGRRWCLLTGPEPGRFLVVAGGDRTRAGEPPSPLRRGLPPAQGGIHILGMAEDLSTAPCIWQTLFC